MSTQNGPKLCSTCNAVIVSDGAQAASKIPQPPTPAQCKLLNYVDYLDAPDRIKALRLVHDIAVYHSEEPLEWEEKQALYQVKVLWELITEIKEG